MERGIDHRPGRLSAWVISDGKGHSSHEIPMKFQFFAAVDGKGSVNSVLVPAISSLVQKESK
jgi:hypothetical protein